jgi:hypothetical protein
MNLISHDRHSVRHGRKPSTPAQRAARAQDRLSALERGVAGELKRLRPHYHRPPSGLRGRTDRVVERLKHLA